jgi:glucose/arabinose dehydrogenase
MTFYTGTAFPGWKDNLFVSALAQARLFRLRLKGEKIAHQEELLRGTGRIRDVRSFDDGALYVIYDQPGRVVRLVPAD